MTPLGFETRVVVDDGQHNAFTDLIAWRGSVWLAYTASPTHFGSPQSRVVVLRSSDGRAWTEAARLDGAGEDLRDPKLAVIRDQLVVLALLNRSANPRPYATVRAESPDGQRWSAISRVGPDGWLLGKPKTADNETWYAPAHNLEIPASALLRSTDGRSWETVSLIHDRNGADETAIEFLPDGRLQAAIRIESGGGYFGSAMAGTLLARARPPFVEWQRSLCQVTRLDGPALFSVGATIYAAGRFQPILRWPFQGHGSMISRKRCSLFRLDGETLTRLLDLPSAGDTAYPGVARWGTQILVSYYTNDPGRDRAWILGMRAPTSVRVAAFDISTFPPTPGGRR